MIELLGLAVLDLAAVVAIALPRRLDASRQRLPGEAAWSRLRWAVSLSALLSSAVVRYTVGGALALALLGWVALRFSDDLAIAAALLLEISGIMLLAIEVLTGHDAERYDSDMTEALEVESLYRIDEWHFLVRTLSLIPGAIRRADAEITSLNRPSETLNNWATSGDKALIAAKLQKSNLETINAAAGILYQIGRKASPTSAKLHESARDVYGWLKKLFAEARDWHDRRRDRVFASRRWRLYGGVVLLVLAGALHSWHLLELHIS